MRFFSFASSTAARLFSLVAFIVLACVCARGEDENPKELSLDLGGELKLELVLIPAGTFDMGSPDTEESRKSGEKKHAVTISKPFYMAKYEVTQEQYEAIAKENQSKNKGPKLPVERVTWEEATKYCEKLSEKSAKAVKLPTEAQWEYACRAGTTAPFSFGETIAADQANYNTDEKYGTGVKVEKKESKTVAVGSFKPNAWGLYDMHGNVWEWCRDWYDSKYPDGAATDPEGPKAGTEDPASRVLRGGSFISPPSILRSAARDTLAPTFRNSHGGFRVIVQIEK